MSLNRPVAVRVMRVPGWRQAGTAMLEMLFVMPLLLLLIFAVAELGNLLNRYETLTKAVRDGARYVSEETYGETGKVILDDDTVLATQRVVVYGHPNLQEGDTPVLPGLNVSDVSVTRYDDNHIMVDTQYTYDPIFGLEIPHSAWGMGR